MTDCTHWELPGANAEPILGDTHAPDDPIGVVCIVHGFLGYKDYGLFPRLASSFADAGFIAHRFNLSHSGMTRNVETFERPDLFERDTWMKQVHDVCTVVEAVREGGLAGQGLPVLLWGHSRGGVTSVLGAARLADGGGPLAGLITAAAPSTTCSMGDEARAAMLELGYAEVVSNRTGQTLRIDAGWLKEQIDDPAGHDVLAAARRVWSPTLVVHGADDPTVPPDNARELAAAAGVEPVLIAGGNHVFNTPNPMPEDDAPSPQLAELLERSIAFARGCV